MEVNPFKVQRSKQSSIAAHAEVAWHQHMYAPLLLSCGTSKATPLLTDLTQWPVGPPTHAAHYRHFRISNAIHSSC